MKKVFLIIGILVTLISCQDTDERSYPSCITDFITMNLNNSPEDPRGRVSKYRIQSKIVYVFEKEPFGRLSVANNENCEFLCIIGGFAPVEICGGEDWKSAKFTEIVWAEPE